MLCCSRLRKNTGRGRRVCRRILPCLHEGLASRGGGTLRRARGAPAADAGRHLTADAVGKRGNAPCAHRVAVASDQAISSADMGAEFGISAGGGGQKAKPSTSWVSTAAAQQQVQPILNTPYNLIQPPHTNSDKHTNPTSAHVRAIRVCVPVAGWIAGAFQPVGALLHACTSTAPGA